MASVTPDIQPVAEADIPPDLAVLISFSGEGGVERMMINLLHEFARLGLQVHLLLIKDNSEHLQHLPDNIRIIRLGSRHALTSIWPLVNYLQQYNPPALLVAKDRAGRAALIARAIAQRSKTRLQTRIVIRLGTNLSAALDGKPAWQRYSRLYPIRRLYPLADAIVAVSEGVAADTVNNARISADKVHVVRNPVITPDLYEQANASLPASAVSDWLTNRTQPVALAAGRLTRQKDFMTLLQAVKQVNQTTPLRLIILGEGRQREALEQSIAASGLQQQVALPGFQANPYAWIQRADVFVLSSRWEGSPNVLTEAAALGIPVVATDCPSGPRELLQDGYYGPLVPMGNAQAMADAIIEVLNDPHPVARLQEATQAYTAQQSAQHYLSLLHHAVIR